MTILDIKGLILEHGSDPEEVYSLYVEDDFGITIKGLSWALSELLKSCDNGINDKVINSILRIFTNIALNDDDIEHLNCCYVILKDVKKRIRRYKNNNLGFADFFENIINRIEDIIEFLEKKKKDVILSNAVSSIEAGRDLNFVSALIGDNKDILSFMGDSNQNILWRLLKKYSLLSADKKEDIDYLFQVILLFITNEELADVISLNIKYYLSALENRKAYHVQEIINILQKNRNISISRLEDRYGICSRAPQLSCHDQANLSISRNGVHDFRHLPTCTVDTDGAVCLDDAFSLIKNRDGSYTLYVYIFFLPSLVPYDSILNKNSIDQIETFYLSGDIRPLYPFEINRLGSLLPGQTRCVETGIWRIRPDFTLEEGSYKLVRGIISSNHRLPFGSADGLIHGNGDDYLTKTLISAVEIANTLANDKSSRYGERYTKKSQSEEDSCVFRDSAISSSADVIREFIRLNARSKTALVAEKEFPYIFVASRKWQSLDLNGQFFREFSGNLSDIEKNIGGFEYFTNRPERHCILKCPVYGPGGSPLRSSPDGQCQYIDLDLLFNPNPSDELIRQWEDRTKELVEHYNKGVPRIAAFTQSYNFFEGHRRLQRKK